eukprot:TRINITY_DN7057_c0_g1_i1.p1 TRINITY_DN7057_c0_g1~~TRINITY_DN7057_c0_g1_i1.p1  ORF type:complete len:413 (+),score=98.64 TRINITY_DN7057_c0_g1_i1:62-1300(+)
MSDSAINQPLIDDLIVIKEEGASVQATTFNLANTIIGAGVLALPYAFSCAGLGVGMFLLIFTGFMAICSFKFLADACTETQQFSYRGISEYIFGTGVAKYLELFVTAYTLGSCCGYPIIISDSVPLVLDKYIESNSFFMTRHGVILIVVIFIFLPFSIPKKINFLRFTSFMCLIFIAYLVFLIVWWYPSHPIPSEPIIYVKANQHLFLALPYLTVSFTAHYNLPNLYKELEGRNPKKMMKVIIMSVIVCLIAYTLAGVFGYLSWRSETMDDILKNYISKDKFDTLLFSLARMGIAIAIGFSFPLVHFALRRSLQSIIWGNEDEGWTRHLSLTFVVISLCTIVAWNVESLGTVLAFSGSIAGMFIVFILPSLFKIKLSKSRFFSKDNALPLFILIMGCIFSVLGTIEAIKRVL